MRVNFSTVCSCFGVRQPATVEPERFVEADGVDDERVALPPADRVTVEARRQVSRVRPPVHVDGPIGVRSADVEDVDPLHFRQLDELDAVRRQELTRDPGRLAARVRLQLVLLPVVVDRSRPRLKRHVRPRMDWIGDAEDRQPQSLSLSVSPAEIARPSALRGAGRAVGGVPAAADDRRPPPRPPPPSATVLRQAMRGPPVRRRTARARTNAAIRS